MYDRKRECETETCGHLVPLEAKNCVHECVSPDCYRKTYAEPVREARCADRQIRRDSELGGGLSAMAAIDWQCRHTCPVFSGGYLSFAETSRGLGVGERG